MKIKLSESKINQIIVEAIDEVTAYHGTGADFDKFNLGKAGTGAGSAAFGHGVYVTSDQVTAKDYAKIAQAFILTYRGETVYSSKNDDYLPENFYNPFRVIYDLFQDCRNFSNAKEKAIRLYELCEENNVEMKSLWRKVVNIFVQSRASDFKMGTQRIMVEVDIPDDSDSWIDWYSPIEWKEIDYIAGFLNDRSYARFFEYMGDDDYEGYMWKDIYGILADALDGMDKASALLYDAGYVGIRYDGGQIFKNNRQYINHVVFNPNDVMIVDKRFLK